MPTTLARNEQRPVDRVSPPAEPEDDDGLRALALRHLENVRKFKRYLVTYMLLMAVLTPVWVITQYETSPGWPKHLSSRSRFPGDWDPWLIWVALVGALIVGIAAYRAYFERETTEADVQREMDRLKTR